VSEAAGPDLLKERLHRAINQVLAINQGLATPEEAGGDLVLLLKAACSQVDNSTADATKPPAEFAEELLVLGDKFAVEYGDDAVPELIVQTGWRLVLPLIAAAEMAAETWRLTR
jgi:hypothetical protein